MTIVSMCLYYLDLHGTVMFSYSTIWKLT